MYLLLLSSDGHHKLFMNNLFYLDREIDIEQVWYSDTDNYLLLIHLFYIKEHFHI